MLKRIISIDFISELARASAPVSTFPASTEDCRASICTTAAHEAPSNLFKGVSISIAISSGAYTVGDVAKRTLPTLGTASSGRESRAPIPVTSLTVMKPCFTGIYLGSEVDYRVVIDSCVVWLKAVMTAPSASQFDQL